MGKPSRAAVREVKPGYDGGQDAIALVGGEDHPVGRPDEGGVAGAAHADRGQDAVEVGGVEEPADRPTEEDLVVPDGVGDLERGVDVALGTLDVADPGLRLALLGRQLLEPGGVGVGEASPPAGGRDHPAGAVHDLDGARSPGRRLETVRSRVDEGVARGSPPAASDRSRSARPPPGARPPPRRRAGSASPAPSEPPARGPGSAG